MKNSRILIVEDEVLIAEHLAKILRSQGYENLTLVHRYSKAIEELEAKPFDLALLDINLDKDTEGVDLAKIIEADLKFPYIFITAQTDPLVLGMAVKLHPKAFISKPFNKVDVAVAVELALSDLKKPTKYLIFKDGWTTVKVTYDDILWAEADGNYLQLFCKSKHYTIRYSLSWLEDELGSDLNFFKVHRSIIVNLRKVQKLESSQVWINDQALAVSKSRHQELKDALEGLK